MTEKTHWLQNPNKNYLGHWDLPSGQDVILTIKTAGWEEVKNPIINTKEAKRVIRFVEEYKWIKPFICNEINAQMILKSTGEKFMEDCLNKRVKIGLGNVKVKGEAVDCLRVRNVKQDDLEPKKITAKQVKELQELVDKTDKSATDICNAYKVGGLNEIRAAAFVNIVKNLKGMVKDGNN